MKCEECGSILLSDELDGVCPHCGMKHRARDKGTDILINHARATIIDTIEEIRGIY